MTGRGDPPLVRAVVLAAGAGRRFGGQKLLASLDGKPVLQHVLDALAAAGVDDPVVVVPPHAAGFDTAFDWRRAERVVNLDPDRGLASSVQTGWATALRGDPEAVLLLLGDQPRVDPSTIRSILAAPLDPERPIVAARYAAGSARNPVRVEMAAAALVGGLSGDRGLGPLLDRQPGLVRSVDGPGSNPDVDRPEDLAALVGADSAHAGAADDLT